MINDTRAIRDNNDKVYHNDIAVNEDDNHISAGQVMYQPQKANANVSGIVAIVFLVAMASLFSMWVLYAYRNPHTTSGQMLIRVSYRKYRDTLV